MKPQKIAGKNTPSQLKKIGLGITASVALASALAITIQDGMLSKFIQSTGITSQNAASLWQPSQDNPYRTQLGTKYSGKLDQLTIVILSKGKTLSTSELSLYLKNLSSGILALGNKPAYTGNQEVQNIIKYLSYELDDARGSLDGIDDFMSELDTFVESN